MMTTKRRADRAFRLPQRSAVAALALAGVLGLGLAGTGFAEEQKQSAPPAAPAAKSPFSADQKAAIEQIVKDYLIANPEVFLEVQTALEAKMEKVQAERLKIAVKENATELFKRPDAPVAGNPKGDVTVVEFFDYNCGYCKRGFGDLAKLIEKDPKVKVVFKELPILSKASEEASRVALAARLQGKYWEMHQALLQNKGQNNEASALKLAEKIGLDVARLKKDMQGSEVSGELSRVKDLANKMGIQGTPHFLVGDKAVPGAPENLLEVLAGHVADVRKNGCQTC